MHHSFCDLLNFSFPLNLHFFSFHTSYVLKQHLQERAISLVRNIT